MSKTPKEIWCTSGQYYDYVTDWSNGSWSRSSDGGVKYVRADRLEELEAKLVKCGKYRDAYAECDRISVDRIKELEAVLREVDAWVDDLGMYAQEGHEPATVFKRVKEVLKK